MNIKFLTSFTVNGCQRVSKCFASSESKKEGIGKAFIFCKLNSQKKKKKSINNLFLEYIITLLLTNALLIVQLIE
jgi:hypothetical protein